MNDVDSHSIAQLIPVIFGAVAIAAGLVAAFARDIRHATLALWIVGLSIGALFMTLGAELLATVQWILSTLVAITFVFFSVMFGEYGARSRQGETREARRRSMAWIALCSLVGLGVAAVLAVGARELPFYFTPIAEAGADLRGLGSKLAQEDFIAIEVVALGLFIALVGGGVVARPEVEDSSVERDQAGGVS